MYKEPFLGFGKNKICSQCGIEYKTGTRNSLKVQLHTNYKDLIELNRSTLRTTEDLLVTVTET